MLIRKLMVGFRSKFLTIIGVLLAQVTLMTCWVAGAKANAKFHIEKDSQGLIRPFKAVSISLPEFVREYGRITSTQFIVGGNWDQELKGTVTLFLRHPLKNEELTEVFYRVLWDNGYSVVDGPAGNGWIIERARDARDDALPLYEASEVPNSSRLVTAYHNLKYANAENVARMMRSFMPANSRIIPSSRTQVFITDTASNIRKMNWMISQLDTAEAAKRQGDALPGYGPPKTCGEHRIEKLVVEKLEIQESGNNGPTLQQKVMKEGGRK